MRRLFTPKKIIIGVVCILVGLALYFYTGAFMPFILAILTALMLEPLVRLVQKYLRLKKRMPAVVIVFLLFVFIIFILIYLSITRLIDETIRFAERVPGFVVEINHFIERLLVRYNETISGLPPIILDEIEKQLETIMTWVTNATQMLLPMLANWAQAIPNMVIVFIVYLISLFLISMDLPKYQDAFFARFQERNAEKVRYMLRRSARFFTGFFKAQFLVSVIIFIVSYIGLLYITPSNALIMSLIIWFIDFVPFIGSIVILAPWSLFHLLSGNTTIGIQLLVLAGILLIIRRTVEPKVMGDQIGLPALPTLIGLWVGLYVFGVIGLIIGPLSIIAFLSAKEAGIFKTDFKI